MSGVEALERGAVQSELRDAVPFAVEELERSDDAQVEFTHRVVTHIEVGEVLQGCEPRHLTHDTREVVRRSNLGKRTPVGRVFSPTGTVFSSEYAFIYKF